MYGKIINKITLWKKERETQRKSTVSFVELARTKILLLIYLVTDKVIDNKDPNKLKLKPASAQHYGLT